LRQQWRTSRAGDVPEKRARLQDCNARLPARAGTDGNDAVGQGNAVKDSWSKIAVILNGNATEMKIVLPEGRWQKFSLPGQSSLLHKSFPSIVVPAYSCAILYQ